MISEPFYQIKIKNQNPKNIQTKPIPTQKQIQILMKERSMIQQQQMKMAIQTYFRPKGSKELRLKMLWC